MAQEPLITFPTLKTWVRRNITGPNQPDWQVKTQFQTLAESAEWRLTAHAMLKTNLSEGPDELDDGPDEESWGWIYRLVLRQESQVPGEEPKNKDVSFWDSSSWGFYNTLEEVQDCTLVKALTSVINVNDSSLMFRHICASEKEVEIPEVMYGGISSTTADWAAIYRAERGGKRLRTMDNKDEESHELRDLMRERTFKIIAACGATQNEPSPRLSASVLKTLIKGDKGSRKKNWQQWIGMKRNKSCLVKTDIDPSTAGRYSCFLDDMEERFWEAKEKFVNGKMTSKIDAEEKQSLLKEEERKDAEAKKLVEEKKLDKQIEWELQKQRTAEIDNKHELEKIRLENERLRDEGSRDKTTEEQRLREEEIRLLREKEKRKLQTETNRREDLLELVKQHRKDTGEGKRSVLEEFEEVEDTETARQDWYLQYVTPPTNRSKAPSDLQRMITQGSGVAPNKDNIFLYWGFAPPLKDKPRKIRSIVKGTDQVSVESLASIIRISEDSFLWAHNECPNKNLKRSWYIDANESEVKRLAAYLLVAGIDGEATLVDKGEQKKAENAVKGETRMEITLAELCRHLQKRGHPSFGTEIARDLSHSSWIKMGDVLRTHSCQTVQNMRETILSANLGNTWLYEAEDLAEVGFKALVCTGFFSKSTPELRETFDAFYDDVKANRGTAYLVSMIVVLSWWANRGGATGRFAATNEPVRDAEAMTKLDRDFLTLNVFIELAEREKWFSTFKAVTDDTPSGADTPLLGQAPTGRMNIPLGGMNTSLGFNKTNIENGPSVSGRSGEGWSFVDWSCHDAALLESSLGLLPVVPSQLSAPDQWLPAVRLRELFGELTGCRPENFSVNGNLPSGDERVLGLCKAINGQVWVMGMVRKAHKSPKAKFWATWKMVCAPGAKIRCLPIDTFCAGLLSSGNCTKRECNASHTTTTLVPTAMPFSQLIVNTHHCLKTFDVWNQSELMGRSGGESGKRWAEWGKSDKWEDEQPERSNQPYIRQELPVQPAPPIPPPVAGPMPPANANDAEMPAAVVPPGAAGGIMLVPNPNYNPLADIHNGRDRGNGYEYGGYGGKDRGGYGRGGKPKGGPKGKGKGKKGGKGKTKK